MLRANRRNIITTLLLGGATALIFKYSQIFSSEKKWHDLLNAGISFGEWELLALDQNNASLIILDPDRDLKIAGINTGGAPTGILHSGSGIAIVVDAHSKHITIFRRRKIVQKLQLDLALEPTLVAMAPGGKLIAVLDRNNGDLSFVSTENGEQIDRLTGLQDAYGLMFDGYGDTLLVTKKNSGDIYRIDTEKFIRKEPFSLPNADGFGNIISLPSENLAIGLPFESARSKFVVFNPDNGLIQKNFNLPTSISNLIFDRTRSRLFAASTSKKEIYIQPLYGNQLRTIEILHHADEFVLLHNEGRFGVLNKNIASLSIYESKNGNLLYQFMLPDEPVTMIYHQWSSKIIVSLKNDNSLWVLDKEAQVQIIDLDGLTPTLFAPAGTAICHA